jgi:hypothetical protein
MAVSAADDRRCGSFIPVCLVSSVARARQDGVQLLFQHRPDEAAYAITNPILDRVEPIVEKHDIGGNSRRLCGSLPHGAVSFPALQRWNHVGSATRRLRQPNFNHSRDGTLPPTLAYIQGKVLEDRSTASIALAFSFLHRDNVL